MRFLSFTTALALLSCPALAEEGFTDLFNGKNLDGWKNVNCAPETWSVKDGMIHCTGKPTGELRTIKQYENFILELEWRHLKSGGNAGVFVWAGPISAKGQPFLRAIEVQVLDHGYGNTASYTTHGDIFPIHGSKMKPHGPSRGMRSFPSEKRSKPSPEWNKYRIECNDGVVRLQVNGKEVSGGSDCSWRKGYIALESEGSPIDFKNIRIKELPSTGATAEQTAPEWRGFETIYTGTDLRGWRRAFGTHKTWWALTEKLKGNNGLLPIGEAWKSKGWRLTHEIVKSDRAGEAIDKKASESPLILERRLEDFELLFDCKLPKKGEKENRISLLLLTGHPETEPIPIFETDDTKGGWQRIHIVIKGSTAKISVNGGEPQVRKLTSDWDGQKRIALSANAAAEFAGIYLLKK